MTEKTTHGFNMDGIEITKGSEIFTDDESVKKFADEIHNATRDAFALFESAHMKTLALAKEKFIG